MKNAKQATQLPDGSTAIVSASELVKPFEIAPLFWLALGTFAVGTEAFMIAAILPQIAAGFSVSLQAAGQLVTIFALTYAVSSPVLTALTGGFDRRRLLMVTMSAFAMANLVAATASGYWSLAFARFLLAIFAGLYTPNATALAGALVPTEWRGRALAIVTGGTSIAVVLGVPLGAIIGTRFGWRMTFYSVAMLAVVAFAGLLFRLPRNIGANLSTASLPERVAVVRQPGVLPVLLVTALWGIGTYSNYTYITLFLDTIVHFNGVQIGFVLFLWGFAAFLGLLSGGLANDKFGSHFVISFSLFILAVALISLSLIAQRLTSLRVEVPMLMAVFIWGFSAWGFFPAQQAHLIGITGLKMASVALSLNASFMYLGFSIGAVMGAFILLEGSVVDLGWIGGLCELAAVALFLCHGRIRMDRAIQA